MDKTCQNCYFGITSNYYGYRHNQGLYADSEGYSVECCEDEMFHTANDTCEKFKDKSEAKKLWKNSRIL